MDACTQASTKTLRIQSTLANFWRKHKLSGLEKKEVYKVWLEFLVDACVQASTKASYFFNFFLLDWFLQTCFLSNLISANVFSQQSLSNVSASPLYQGWNVRCVKGHLPERADISNIKIDNEFLFIYFLIIYLLTFLFIDLFKIFLMHRKYKYS